LHPLSAPRSHNLPVTHSARGASLETCSHGSVVERVVVPQGRRAPVVKPRDQRACEAARGAQPAIACVVDPAVREVYAARPRLVALPILEQLADLCVFVCVCVFVYVCTYITS
jgi:hypothetical protein